MNDPTKRAPKRSTPARIDETVYLISKGRPHRYGIELRADTTPILLALMQFDIGSAADITHSALCAVWHALRKSPIPTMPPKSRASRAGQILTIQEIMKGLLDDPTSEVPPQKADL